MENFNYFYLIKILKYKMQIKYFLIIITVTLIYIMNTREK